MKKIFIVLVATATSYSQAGLPQRTFKSPDGAFLFRYPSSLVLCKPVYETPDAESKGSEAFVEKKLVGWAPESCGAYLPICPGLSLSATPSGLVNPEPVVCMAYPSSRYEGTNLGGAAFSVSTVPESTTRADCLEDRTGHQKIHWATIGGVKFKVSMGGEGATSHGSVSYVYVTFHKGQCYDVEVVESYTTSTAYDPETYKKMQFKDDEKVRRMLLRIVGSFRFLR